MNIKHSLLSLVCAFSVFGITSLHAQENQLAYPDQLEVYQAMLSLDLTEEQEVLAEQIYELQKPIVAELVNRFDEIVMQLNEYIIENNPSSFEQLHEEGFLPLITQRDARLMVTDAVKRLIDTCILVWANEKHEIIDCDKALAKAGFVHLDDFLSSHWDVINHLIQTVGQIDPLSF